VNFEQQMFRHPEKGKLLLCAKNFFLSSDASVFTETILISAQRNSEMWKNCTGQIRTAQAKTRWPFWSQSVQEAKCWQKRNLEKGRQLRGRLAFFLVFLVSIPFTHIVHEVHEYSGCKRKMATRWQQGFATSKPGRVTTTGLSA
jgi:hypothetical protein